MLGRTAVVTLAGLLASVAVADDLCPPPPNPFGKCPLELDRSVLTEADADLNGSPDNVGTPGDFCNGASPAQCSEFTAPEIAFGLIVGDPLRQDVTCSAPLASVWIMSDTCDTCLASGFESVTLYAGTTTATALKVVVSDDNGDVCFCGGLLECTFSVEVECSDGADGDGDGLVDAADPDCCADQDQDGFCGAGDCDDNDPTVHALPGEAADLTVSIVAGQTIVAWAGQPGARADLVTGLADELRADDGFPAAQCLAEGEPETSWWDSRVDPLPGAAYYYVARLENNCGASGYGQSSPGVTARVDLDAASPCP